MEKVYKKTKMLTDKPNHYCPGCGHGIAQKLVAEVLEEIGAEGNVVGVVPVGCAVFAYDYYNCDCMEASHGRAPAVATGVKRTHPNTIVFTYQGDGDLASIGMAETVHAAARGENITIIFINNNIYGMTGGQMAPTTLVGQKATTCQKGRDPLVNGYPVNVSEMLKELRGSAYIARTALFDLKHVMETKKAIKKAFEYQIAKKGFSMVEIVSTCPTNWRMTPSEAFEWSKDVALKTFPLGVFKEI